MKPGDIVVCVSLDNSEYSNRTKFESRNELTIGKSYTIQESWPGNTNCVVINDKNSLGEYWSYRFISLEKWREQQLNQILDEETF